MALDLLHIASSYDCEGLLNAVDEAKVPLLDIMIDNQFKDCVAHTNVQMYLSEIWRGGLLYDHVFTWGVIPWPVKEERFEQAICPDNASKKVSMS